ncbi:cardiotrophin-2-like [Bombina bombina]|uniref:cardiotrophin-2-like n=1 Tax=Bombina bombina TaxID=8345 RepID=UPI00235A825D|nr:cardiotrophin-2-like [Bombina bombina]
MFFPFPQLEYQGLPFSGPGFSFPSWQEKGLPTASLGYRIWRCLCAGERLLLSRDSFSAIAEFFQLVLDDQLLLNSKAKDLLRLLDTARISSEAMLNNLASGLRDLGFQPPPPQPELLNWSSSGANDFQRKVRGYILCREYRDWLARVAKDMEILKRTFRGVESESQERKDCCRT